MGTNIGKAPGPTVTRRHVQNQTNFRKYCFIVLLFLAARELAPYRLVEGGGAKAQTRVKENENIEAEMFNCQQQRGEAPYASCCVHQRRESSVASLVEIFD
jgi:hypothetical protein